MPASVVCPEQASSLPGSHEQSQFRECVAAVGQPAPFSPHAFSPVAVVSRETRASSQGSGHTQAPGHKPQPKPVAATGASTASPRDVGIAAWAPGCQAQPRRVEATGASTASPRDVGIAAWAPRRQSPPVAATSARAEASSREARVAQAPGGQPVATDVRAGMSSRGHRVTSASGESTTAVRREALDKLGGAFPASCHRDTMLSPAPRAATGSGPGRGEGFAGTAAKCLPVQATASSSHKRQYRIARCWDRSFGSWPPVAACSSRKR